MKTLFYSFASFKHLHAIKNEVGMIFVFKKLKADLEILKDLVKQNKVEYIIGVANSEGTHTTIEPKAINRFNKGKINWRGKDSYSLHIHQSTFKLGKPTHTFCNWT